MQKGSGGVGPGGGRSKARSGKRGSRRSKKGRGRKRGGRPGRPGQNRPRGRPRAHCVCTACGTKVPLYTDVPCYVMSCPKCGLTMVKEGAKPQGSDEVPTFVP